MALVEAVVFLGIENSPGGRFHSQHREEISGDHFGIDALSLVINTERRAHQPAAQHLGEWGGLLLVVLIDRVGVHAAAHVAAVMRSLLEQHDQALRILHR